MLKRNISTKMVGRPSTHARRKEEDELPNKKYGINRIGTKYACSKCGVVGHNKNRCGQSSNTSEPTLPTKSASKLKLQMKKIARSNADVGKVALSGPSDFNFQCEPEGYEDYTEFI